MKQLMLTLMLLSLCVSGALAAVTITPIDPQQKILRVSYEIIDNDYGVKSFVFPPDGFDFADGPIALRGIYDVDSGEMLQGRVVTLPTGRQAIEVIYAAPVPQGRFYKTRFTFDVPTSNFQVDQAGRWVVSYSTGHELFFLIPEGQQLVHSETPVRLEEEGGRVKAVYDPKWDNRRVQKFLFKTRSVR